MEAVVKQTALKDSAEKVLVKVVETHARVGGRATDGRL